MRAARPLLLVLGFWLVLGATTASAQDKKLGVGLRVGEPSGLNGRYMLAEKAGIEATLGTSFLNRFGCCFFEAQGLFIYSPFVPYRNDKFDLPLYVGAGVLIDIDSNFSFLALGARVPVGVTLDLKSSPWQAFFELGVQFLF